MLQKADYAKRNASIMGLSLEVNTGLPRPYWAYAHNAFFPFELCSFFYKSILGMLLEAKYAHNYAFFRRLCSKYALCKRRFNGGIMLQMFSTWSCPLSNAILCSPFSEVLRKSSSHISQQLCKRYMRIYVGQLHCIEELRYGRRWMSYVGGRTCRICGSCTSDNHQEYTKESVNGLPRLPQPLRNSHRDFKKIQ